MPGLDRLLYVDDSGRPQSGLVVFGWIEFAPDRWSSVLRDWLDLRGRLWRTSGIPVTEELHTVDHVNGRGRISRRFPERHRHDGVDFWKDLGREVAEECLETLRCAQGLRVGAVYRRGQPAHFAATKKEVYRALLSQVEHELEHSGALAMVFMDGDGSDPTYRSAHRSLQLDQRRVIEDPIHLDSQHSQLEQMADLVAWSANAHVDQHERNAFAWHWYERYLAERDPMRGPQPV